MEIIVAIVVMALVGAAVVGLASTDIGQIGCSAVVMFFLAVSIGAVVLFFMAILGFGCVAMIS